MGAGDPGAGAITCLPRWNERDAGVRSWRWRSNPGAPLWGVGVLTTRLNTHAQALILQMRTSSSERGRSDLIARCPSWGENPHLGLTFYHFQEVTDTQCQDRCHQARVGLPPPARVPWKLLSTVRMYLWGYPVPAMPPGSPRCALNSRLLSCAGLEALRVAGPSLPAGTLPGTGWIVK